MDSNLLIFYTADFCVSHIGTIMAENRLNIISVMDENSSDQSYQSSRHTRTKELQAKFERLWLIDPERFNPLRNCMERERLERTWQLLTKHVALTDQPAVGDIGCAAGIFSRRLRDAGAQVEAVDIAENALKKFKEVDAERIQLKQEAMPETHLSDQGYKVIICTELIAELPREDYRLFFAELSRLIQPDGYLVCSSPIDIDSVGGVERLIELAQSEFDIIEEVASYHALYLRLKRFFNAPSRFIEGWQNLDFKRKEMSSLKGFNRLWFWLNTTPFLVWFWYVCNPCIRPIHNLLNKKQKILLILEKMCRFLWDRDGISHYLFIAKRRPLPSINPNDIPLERPKRKEVWD
jgi:2-polyprenyl-3-methyl-5-hydroxy-6-metoxy-1,4-benzoquinol methylase